MSDNGLISLVRHLPSNIDAPRTARNAAAQVLGQVDGVARAEDLALVVSELVSNAVIHGADGHVELRLVASPAMIRVEVRDGGTTSFEWPARGVEGHWGLSLVRMFTERSGLLRQPSTIVWCELDLA
jgi:anti-sigma regulatory factor (Ser/Thr protein kinase)